MQGRRNSVLVALGAALFGCAAAPVITDLPISGREVASPPAAARVALEAHMQRFGAGKFTVGAARYAIPEAGLGWQPLLSRVATDPRVQREAQRLVLPSDRPEEWLVELWRTRGRDGFAVALLAPAGAGPEARLLGYYAVTFAPDFKPEVRGKQPG